jgi:signal recognition particle subunit SRP54
MFETLTKGFRSAKQRFSGQAELDEATVDEALRDVRAALLEADVGYEVVQEFCTRVKEKAVGLIVKVRASSKEKVQRVSPEDHFVKLCNDELIDLMGPVDTSLEFAKKGPTGIMMVGLQGSGKTTTVGKLALMLQKRHKRPLLVAADVYRPAAIDQLKVLGDRIGVPVYSEPGGSPPDICEKAVRVAAETGRDVVIFDTAGRLAIDEPLMNELSEIKRRCNPANILFVVDAMIGQDAVATAKAFNDRLDYDGVVLTKLDGDARGGAALSVKAVTGKPIKLVGMGESSERLEEFRPDGMASRILGRGDVVGLIQQFEEVVDQEKAEQDAMRMLKGKFDMNDFLEQIGVLQKMGSLKDLIEKIPGIADLPEGVNIDDRELVRIKAVISSMTEDERRFPDRFIVTSWEEIVEGDRRKKKRSAFYDQSRIRRVARGSGQKESDVTDILNRFAMMRQMMQQLGQSTGLLGRLPGFKQMAQLKKFAGMDMNKLAGMMGGGGGGGGFGAGGGGGSFQPPRRNEDRARDKKKRKDARKARKVARKRR